MDSKTQIVATVGPACGTPEVLTKMIAAGMNIARLNFSHGTHEGHAAYIAAVREAAAQAGVRIPIILDLSGPRETTDDGHQFDPNKAEITEKDLQDVDFGIAQQVDYFAHSYVGSAADVKLLRSELEKRGSKTPIIAKIERQEAVNDFDAILEASDAIMIARGDLGQAVPIEEVPFIERDILKRAEPSGKPVIVATQMMLSMVQHPIPTRAEVTDVAFAVLHGAAAIMLSEEAAIGHYPVETVATMRRVATRAEAERGPISAHAL